MAELHATSPVPHRRQKLSQVMPAAALPRYGNLSFPQKVSHHSVSWAVSWAARLSIRFCFCCQMEKQRAKEEMDKKLLEQRAVFIEKAKTINIDAVSEERSRKSGGKVSLFS